VAPTSTEVQQIVQTRCITCHAAKPTWAGMTEAPKGLSLETMQQVHDAAARIKAQAVSTQIMPLANVTQMTDEERQILGRWIDAGAPLN
jgi:uncharacterized membrane protein